MSQTYADIIIDISHSAIDRVFQYRIGDAWKEQVQVGSLVTVPFGKGNAGAVRGHLPYCERAFRRRFRRSVRRRQGGTDPHRARKSLGERH